MPQIGPANANLEPICHLLKRNRFSECCVMNVPMMFPCFPSLRFWVLLKNFICGPKHVRKKCHQTCLQAVPAQTIPSKNIPGTATFLKAMLKIRMQPSSQAVPQGPPHMSCSTRTIVPAFYHLSYQKKHRNKGDMILPSGTHKLAKITTFGPTGSEVCRLQVQARHKCTCCTA